MGDEEDHYTLDINEKELALGKHLPLLHTLHNKNKRQHHSEEIVAIIGEDSKSISTIRYGSKRMSIYHKFNDFGLYSFKESLTISQSRYNLIKKSLEAMTAEQ